MKRDKKHFGFTSGTHSQFEIVKESIKKQFEASDPTDPMYEIKENKVKNYKKEIE